MSRAWKAGIRGQNKLFMHSFRTISLLLFLTLVSADLLTWKNSRTSGNGTTYVFHDGPVVDLDYGQFLGSDHGKIRSFLGIPYAEPPLGNLRFRPPQPPTKYLGFMDARKQGFACLQPHKYAPLYGFRLKDSEDCLNLNIWMPAGHSKADGLLPVMVWILPGGFTSGYTANPLYGILALFTFFRWQSSC